MPTKKNPDKQDLSSSPQKKEIKTLTVTLPQLLDMYAAVVAGADPPRYILRGMVTTDKGEIQLKYVD
jgi:hypothetical protein